MSNELNCRVVKHQVVLISNHILHIRGVAESEASRLLPESCLYENPAHQISQVSFNMFQVSDISVCVEEFLGYHVSSILA